MAYSALLETLAKLSLHGKPHRRLQDGASELCVQEERQVTRMFKIKSMWAFGVATVTGAPVWRSLPLGASRGLSHRGLKNGAGHLRQDVGQSRKRGALFACETLPAFFPWMALRNAAACSIGHL